jgi:hypothetical protein
MTVERLNEVVNHEAVDETVDRATIRLQLETASALRDRLDASGGVILGDEVGAGKTYIAFALIAQALQKTPDRGVVILVPSSLLLKKWCRQLKEYLRMAVRDQAVGHELAGRIVTIDKTMRNDGSFQGEWGDRAPRNAIVVAQHNAYSGKTSEADKRACVKAAAQRLDLGRRPQIPALLRACQITSDGSWARWASDDVLDASALEPLRPVLEAYLDGERDLWDPMRFAVQDVRLNVGRKLLPDAALVIIDEAHNLKSTESANYRALMSVLSARFDALLFLTATPFQLGRDELLGIVRFFRHARAYDGREREFTARLDAMRTGMTGWVRALDHFRAAWQGLDVEQAGECRALIERGDAPGNSGGTPVEQTVRLFGSCLVAKRALEEGLRPFLVRSVRERLHDERPGVPDDLIADDSRIPLALVDRLITELLESKRRTFIASALISACSSWDSLREAAVSKESGDDGADPHTRKVLNQMLRRGVVGVHPKVEHTLAVCREGLRRGDKTLVFVEREQTGRRLRDQLMAEFPEGVDRSARERLQDRSRFGWPSLRENYLHTIYPLAFDEGPDPRSAAALVDLAWVRELWRRVDPEGPARNFVIEKRFWEHVLFRVASERQPEWRSGVQSAELARSVLNLLEPDYIVNGLDLRSGATGHRAVVSETAIRAEPRDPRLPFAEAFIAYPSPWTVGREQLAYLSPELRSEFVDTAASAFARSHFRNELAAREIEGDADAHFRAAADLLLDRTGTWPHRFEALADQAREAVAAKDADDRATRVTALIDALGSTNRIQYISGGTGPETQRHAVDGFNTPLYPEVIITTSVLAEGLDLHRFCRRVVHHDLPWNPAKLEQRTGRVDRVGSLAQRLSRETGARPVPIDVWLPYVRGTYDEFIFERVMARRREFRCLLGNRPEWQGDGQLGEDERGMPWDETLATRLQVDLGPRKLGSAPVAAA